MRKNWLLRTVKIALFAVAAVGVVSYVVMSLWNALMPGIFGARTIGFWQALGLLLLSKLLFGGFRPSGGGPGWRRRMRGRWEAMSPEERQKFMEGMQRRGCFRPGRTQNTEAGVQA